MMTTDSMMDLLEALPGGSARHLDPGAVLFREGEPASWLCGVIEGRIRLERTTVEGRTVLIHSAASGETFAEAAPWSDSFHCTATAAVASRVRVVPADRVREAIRSDPEIASRFVALLASQVRSLRTRLELRNILSARERLLSHLTLAASADGEVRLGGTLKELAAELGLAHETLYRELSALEEEGCLTRDGRRIRLSDPRACD